MSKRRLITTFGDADPIDYGGGIVYEQDGRVIWEYTAGAGEGHWVGDPPSDNQCLMWDTQIIKELPSWMNGDKELKSFNSTYDRRLSRKEVEQEYDLNRIPIEQLTEEDEWYYWANAYYDIYSYYGFDNLGNPEVYTKSQLKKWWNIGNKKCQE